MLVSFFCPGPTEIIIIAAIALLLIGPKALPKMARSLGSVIPSFKAGLNDVKEIEDEVRKVTDDVTRTVKDA